MSDKDASDIDADQEPRTEDEELLEGQIAQKADIDDDDLPDGLYHG